MTIRPALASDLPTLNAIYGDAVLETRATCHVTPPSDDDRRAWWQAHQVPQCPILVAEYGDAVLGYASLSWWVQGAVYAHTVELSVYVAADARGQGVGKALTQAILDAARDARHHVVIARIWARTRRASRFSRRSDSRPSARFGSGLSQWAMGRLPRDADHHLTFIAVE